MPDFPWDFNYEEQAEKSPINGSTIYRPYVPISMSRDGLSSEIHLGFVDTGAASCIASWVLATEMDFDPTQVYTAETIIKVGGQEHNACVCDVELSLHHCPDCRGDDEVETWSTQVLFCPTFQYGYPVVLLGSHGFGDQFGLQFHARDRILSIDKP